MTRPDSNGKFYLYAGRAGLGLVVRIGAKAAVLNLVGTKEEIFREWQVKTLDIPIGVIMNLELVGTEKKS